MIDLYIAGYKGWKVLRLCYENKININCVYFYKSKQLSFMKILKNYVLKIK